MMDDDSRCCFILYGDLLKCSHVIKEGNKYVYMLLSYIFCSIVGYNVRLHNTLFCADTIFNMPNSRSPKTAVL